MALDLILVRHGETKLNAERVFMGHDPVPLSPEGRRQVELLGERLRAARITRMVASDIRRTEESAEILSAPLGLSFEMDAGLREIDVGEAKGLAYAEAARRWPGVFDPAGAERFPGGESFVEVADRAAAYLRRAVVHAGDGRVLVVTHGGVVRGLGARLLDLSLAAVGPFIVENASITMFRIDGLGTHLVTWNDTAHLGPVPGRNARPLIGG